MNTPSKACDSSLELSANAHLITDGIWTIPAKLHLRCHRPAQCPETAIALYENPIQSLWLQSRIICKCPFNHRRSGERGVQLFLACIQEKLFTILGPNRSERTMFQHAIHAHYCYLFQMFRIYQKKKSRIELNFRIQSAQCYYDFRPVSYFSERWLYTGYEYELRELRNISKFSPRIDRIFFPGKHLIHFLVLKMKNFRNFVLEMHCRFWRWTSLLKA